MTNNTQVSQERRFKRMTLNQRIQHITLMTSFFALVITGFPVTFPESKLASIVVGMLGGFTMRSALHRLAAIILICLTIYHTCYILLTPQGRSELKALMPKFKDGFDALQMLKFYIGLAKEVPKFDRFNFIEKFEYLALAWGSVVMIVTGFALWFQNQSMTVLPKWALDIAKVIHSYEALLAFLAIIIWHFYHVHLNPEVFPMSHVWLNGEISEHELKTLHPLEYERILEAEAREREVEESKQKSVPLTSDNRKNKE